MENKAGKLGENIPNPEQQGQGKTPTGHTVADAALSGGEENNVALPPYEPVPVKAARAIAEQYGKSIVIIFAHDPVHGLLHTTTYGTDMQSKAWAAQGGEIGTKALGGLREAATDFEDYRLVRIAELSAAATAAWHLCESLLAVPFKDGATDELITEVRDALAAALAKARGEQTDAR